ncbi:MAG: DNA mismatch repair protein MutS [Planctomycetota bacterium]|nr:MAG: DNA mismatch repair protein MutS [Planctomycetota bacterium]
MGKSDPLDTPMMRQYLATKAEHPDCLLFMRMGDFYEIFLDDAVEASRLLGITLTSRNKDDPQPVAMAGVPHHSLSQHLPKLLAAGKRVAIMDQLEDPKEAKGLVKRGLSRIISPGTCFEEELLEPHSQRLLVALSGLGEGTQSGLGLAAVDLASGGVWLEHCAHTQALAQALARWRPVELVLPQRVADAEGTGQRLAELFEGQLPPPVSAMADGLWAAEEARRWLCQQLRVGSLAAFDLDGDGPEIGHMLGSACAALRYGIRNSGTDLGHVRRLVRVAADDHLVLDAHCQRNLEVVANTRDGGRAHTLLATIDRCRSAPGSRLLGQWLLRPLARCQAISQRHEAVAFLAADSRRRGELRRALDDVYDLERLVGRVACERTNARDLVQLASSLQAAAVIADIFRDGLLPELFANCLPNLLSDGVLCSELTKNIVDDPPLSINEGGMIRPGLDSELDELRAIRTNAGDWLARYQSDQARELGLKNLKVGYNKVFGYYIELGKQFADQVPANWVRKQTLVNAERYISEELKEYEDKVLGAEDRIRVRERLIFDALRQQVLEQLDALQACSESLAVLDCVASLSEVAVRGGWCRPEVDESTTCELVAARHPVVEAVVGAGRFIANDCRLDAEAQEHPRLLIITGPNMAGKSTYIRQIALCTILAQAGSFVPATAARMGIVDRIFTRIGAGDELARNMSTFMVEMAETAAILHNATRRSLVILDEVGRGTSTFDGLSLAWAITEHLHDVPACRCLFATHYHELTDLAELRPGIHNCTVAVAEQDDEVVFLHRIVDGAATKSYGIHVARLAGVPRAVVARAQEVQQTLDELNISLTQAERPGSRPQDLPAPMQLSLFAPSISKTVQDLAALELDELSPRQAWKALETLVRQARREAQGS